MQWLSVDAAFLLGPIPSLIYSIEHPSRLRPTSLCAISLVRSFMRAWPAAVPTNAGMLGSAGVAC